ncbi:MAG: right-handed parallel beta-helix repeat-containing protein [Sphaerochaetaceae bacterium]
MTMRTSGDVYGGSCTPIVDNMIGDVYPAVAAVAHHLAEICYLAANLDNLKPLDVELRSNDATQAIEWRYVEEGAEWQVLVSYVDLLGADVQEVLALLQQVSAQVAADAAQVAADRIVCEEAVDLLTGSISLTPAPGKIPIADENGHLHQDWFEAAASHTVGPFTLTEGQTEIILPDGFTTVGMQVVVEGSVEFAWTADAFDQQRFTLNNNDYLAGTRVWCSKGVAGASLGMLFASKEKEYVDGVALTVDTAAQVIIRGDERYLAKLPASFPVALTGTWATDEPLLVIRADDGLRQDLADDTDPAKGAGLSGFKGRTVYAKLSEFVSAKDSPYSAAGDGVTDDTSKVQALLSAGGLCFIPEGEYMIKAHRDDGGFGGVRPVSNSCIVFHPNAKFTAITNDKDSYAIVNLASVENVTIINATLEGERDTHTGVTGEFGMGVYMRDCTNITIENPRITKCWGDGIYIGQVGSVDGCHNVRILGGSISDCRRQGMSVISVDGLYVEGTDISDIAGTPPAAGIDFEPNNSECLLDNITLVNVKTRNTASGIIIDLNHFGDGVKVKTCNIRAIGYSDEGSDVGITLTRCLHATRGVIEFDSPVVKNNLGNGILIRRWHQDGAQARILTPTVINPNRGAQGAVLNAAGIACYTLLADVTPDGGSGNVLLDDPRVVFESGVSPAFVPQISFRDTLSNSVRNVRILNMRDGPSTFIETTNEWDATSSSITTKNVIFFGHPSTRTTGFINHVNGAVSILGTTSTATIVLEAGSLWRAGAVKVRGFACQATTGTPGATSIGAAESAIFFRSKASGDVPVQISKTDLVTSANLVLSVSYLASPPRVVITATTPVATLISWDVDSGGSAGAPRQVIFS